MKTNTVRTWPCDARFAPACASAQSVICVTFISLLLMVWHNGIPAIYASEFKAEAKPVMAVENGPVIVQVTITYVGEKPVTIIKPIICVLGSHSKPVPISAPQTWISYLKPTDVVLGSSPGLGPPQITLDANDKVDGVLYLHHMFHSIPPGASKIKITVPIESPDRRVLEKLDVDVNLDVSSDQSEGFQKALKTLSQSILSASRERDSERLRLLDAQLLFARDSRFVQLLLDAMIASKRIDHDSNFLAESRFLYSWARQSKENMLEFVRYLADYGTFRDQQIIYEMHQSNAPLTKASFVILKASNSLAVRAFIFKYWPQEFSESEQASMKSEVETLCKCVLYKNSDSGTARAPEPEGGDKTEGAGNGQPGGKR
ncbi:MAG: hypothetical protein ACREP2_14405 [Rhodanobacteraceae bacterium]